MKNVALPASLLDDPAFFQCEQLHATIKKTVCADRMMKLTQIENGEMPPRQRPNITERLWLSHCRGCEVGERNRKEVESMAEIKEPQKMEVVKTKRCTKCGGLKPLDEFRKSKKAKDGREVQCKECRKEYRKDWSKRKNKKGKSQKPMAKDRPVAAAIPQPDPQPGNKIVLHYVMVDLVGRSKEGEKKYKTPLKSNNGRDALMDAYQEALDLSMYLRQVILERDGQ